jgi:hypothetical protein
MAGSLEKDVYARMMTRALESPEAARALTNVGSKAEAEKAKKQAEEKAKKEAEKKLKGLFGK